MKLYLVTRTDGGGYDEFDSVVVCAESEEKARNIHPYEKENWSHDYCWDCCSSSWVTRDKQDTLMVTYLGEAEIKKQRVILASFNAG